MASLFVIREKNTGTYCTSSKHGTFNSDLQAAAMFNRRENAEWAAKAMFRDADLGILNPYGGHAWTVTDHDGIGKDYHHAMLTDYIQMLKENQAKHGDQRHQHEIEYLRNKVTEQRCEMEVVEVKLVLA